MDRVQPAEGARGVFVSLEGVDGSGKSTQAAILRDLLAQGGADVVSLREPGGTAISEKVRALVLDPANAEMCDECELLLYEASRAQLVRQVVEPALAAGDVVVCDRFLDSTFAYQAAGRGLDAGLVRRANELGSCGFLPDRTVVFDIDPARALARATRGGADRLERSGLALQERVRAAYLELAREQPGRVRVVDAAGTVGEVTGRLVACLADLLPGLGG
ncbi:dTMP kinase [Atopobiaceae bacterium HCP3S3_F7]|uniref:Thymidylate kinase n=1 Tax=Olsenella absiana TaxID=3115222 RepID=A0ABU7R9S5_9ACTN|nr:dTMP kinase [Olsenella sp.]